MPPLPPVTKTLILICVGIFCLGLLIPPQYEALAALWPLSTGLFQPWQVVTYAFLHGSAFHLLFNMLGLWMFGSELENLWGPRRYLQFLAASAPTVGASGALYGLLLAFGMLFPNRTIQLLIPPIPMKAKVYVAIVGGLELLMGLGGPSGVAHFAHLGGMLGGFLMIRYWRGQAPFPRRRR